MVILARINQQLSDNLGGLKKRLRKENDISFSKYLDKERVLFLDVKTRDDAIEYMVNHLAKLGLIKEEEHFLRTVIEREKLVSTSIGMNMALPHAKLSGYNDFFIGIGIAVSDGIEWDSLDGTLVKAFFLIGGPDNKQIEYLKILSCLTMAVKQSQLRKQLFSLRDAQAVIDLFKGY